MILRRPPGRVFGLACRTFPPRCSRAAVSAARATPLTEQLLGLERKAELGKPRAPTHKLTGPVVIHNWRDTKFLGQVTAIGIFGTLMSFSAASYAFVFKLSTLSCVGLTCQAGAAWLFMTMYLRTYVARAVVDPGRAQLTITGCGLFGEPQQKDQVLPLYLIQPGSELNPDFIRFSKAGSALNPARWIQYRIPRSPLDEEQRSKGKQVDRAVAAMMKKPAPVTVAAPVATPEASHARRFQGAGLGSASPAQRPAGMRAPAPKADKAGGSVANKAEPLVAQTLAGLKLRDGLPASPQDEQRVLGFFDEPEAYALSRA